MRKVIKYTLSFVLVSCMRLCAQETDTTHMLKIIVHPEFKNEALVLVDAPYVNAYGDTLYIDEFKFYISNIRFNKTKTNKVLNPKDYILVDTEDSASLSFHIPILKSQANTELYFDIGTDSIANISGAIEGALDPIKGMYWAWNSGYINVKLTGHSSVCPTLRNAFEFHVGGYLAPYQTVRAIKVDIPITAIQNGEIHLYCDLSKWLNQIDLRKSNNVVIPGVQATQMAELYKSIFSVR